MSSRFAFRPQEECTPTKKFKKPSFPKGKLLLTGVKYVHQKGDLKGHDTGNGGLEVQCAKEHNMVVATALRSVDLGNDYKFDNAMLTHKNKMTSLKQADKALTAIQTAATVSTAERSHLRAMR